MLIRFKLEGKRYEIDPDKLTLGEGEILQEDYGMTDFSEINFFSPRQLSGLAFCAIRRKDTDRTEDDARALAKAVVSGEVFEDINRQIAAKAEAQKANPPVPAGHANGVSETTRKTSGKRRSPASTG